MMEMMMMEMMEMMEMVIIDLEIGRARMTDS